MTSVREFARRLPFFTGLRAVFLVCLLAGIAACQQVPNYEGRAGQTALPTTAVKPPPPVVSVDRDP